MNVQICQGTCCWAVLVSVWGLTLAGPLTAQEYVKIEEDWELKVDVPDFRRAIPQVSLGTKPDPNSPIEGQIKYNYRQTPSGDTAFEGGLQVQIWRTDTRRGTGQFFDLGFLNTTNETIRMTIFMTRDGEYLRFGMSSLQSVSWGEFTGVPVYKVEDNIPTFTEYNSSWAVENSGILFGANRVGYLKLVEVRKHRADGTIDRETEPQIVHEKPIIDDTPPPDMDEN